jgi:hypothetical protein
MRYGPVSISYRKILTSELEHRIRRFELTLAPGRPLRIVVLKASESIAGALARPGFTGDTLRQVSQDIVLSYLVRYSGYYNQSSCMAC